jgi:hypothetical protein
MIDIKAALERRVDSRLTQRALPVARLRASYAAGLVVPGSADWKNPAELRHPARPAEDSPARAGAVHREASSERAASERAAVRSRRRHPDGDEGVAVVTETIEDRETERRLRAARRSREIRDLIARKDPQLAAMLATIEKKVSKP